jgi:hypothetical protein
MKISCLLVSHNKPQFIGDAIKNVLAQEHKDFELLIMDSGVLIDKGYFSQWTDERIKVFRSNETEELRQEKAMAPWCYNEFFRRNLTTGELITYLCDDDIFYSNAFSVFSRWMTNNPNMLAVYASIDLVMCLPDNPPNIYGQRRALEIGGRGAYKMDCRVDYLQFCHRRSLLYHFDGNEYWPEGKSTEKHADGIFMDKCGDICHIYPIPVKIGQNRRTPQSTYYPVKNENTSNRI